MQVLQRLILCVFLSALAAAPAGAEALPERIGWIAAAAGAEYSGTDDRWQEALANMPAATGTALRTTAKGQAELRLAEAAIVLGPDSEAEIARYSAEGLQLVLRRGSIGVRLARLPAGVSIEIDTARGGVWLLEPGRYALNAGGDAPPTSTSVYEGRARFVGSGVDRIVTAGTATLVPGEASGRFTSEVAGTDPFASWWQDHPVAAGGAKNPLPAALPGAAGLSGGSWERSGEYGAVWFPENVSADWAPFHAGRWRAIAPWGWTWIDDAPWGFVPSHYGRWARLKKTGEDDERWGWVPGGAIAEAAYVPAAVGYIGTAGIGLSYAGGSGPAIAWFPLGPGEPYWPGYTGDAAAIREANAGIKLPAGDLEPDPSASLPAAIVAGAYRYRAFAGIVPRPVFAAGSEVAPALLSLPARRLDVAPVLGGLAPVPPGEPTTARRAPPPAKPEKALAAVAPQRHRTARVAVARPAAKPRAPAARHVVAAKPRAHAVRHLAAAKPHAAARKQRAAPARVAAAAPNPSPHARQHLAAARRVMRQ